MTFNRLLAAALGAAALLAAGAQTAAAQDAPTETTAPTGQDAGQDNSQGQEARGSRRNQAPREQTPEQARAAVESALAAVGGSCQITEAKHLGQNDERQMLYEAVCADAPGYLVKMSTPPEAYNCLELEGAAARTRAEDPAAPAGQLCTLPGNQNGLQLVSGWATEAGVSCSVDQAVAIGKGENDSLVYEVGCAGADGYWLEQKGGAWTARDCLSVTGGGGKCQFTTAEEQAAGYTAKLATTEASDCSVAQIRMMGQNANGRFAEVKCATEGLGYVIRMNGSGAVQQVYACAIAQRIGGGCTLTPVNATPVGQPPEAEQ